MDQSLYNFKNQEHLPKIKKKNIETDISQKEVYQKRKKP